MNYAQMKKVRKIIAKVQRMPRHLEIGGWVEKEYVYIFVKAEHFEESGKDARCLFAIDRMGNVAAHHNYAPMELRDDALIMNCRA